MKKSKYYVKQLNNVLRDNPELNDGKLVYSTGDEGNGYSTVYYPPSLGPLDEAMIYTIGEILEDPEYTLDIN
jgi:hypothetical protein